MQQLRVRILLPICILLAFTNCSFGQALSEKTIEGKIIISFFMTSAKPIDSYVTIEGTDCSVKIDSTGHFKLTGVKTGANNIKIQLWAER